MSIASDLDCTNAHFKIYWTQKNRVLRLLKYIDFSRSDRVADYGCGNGLLLDMIADKIGSYDGVDLSADCIQMAERRQRQKAISNAHFYCMSITEFCDCHVDLYDKAFAIDFAEHINDEDFIPIFTSIKRSLKEGGKLYIHTPNGEYIFELLKKWGVMQRSEGHVGIRSDAQYRCLLDETGYSCVKIAYVPHYLRYLSYFHVLSYAPVFGKHFRARLFIECKR